MNEQAFNSLPEPQRIAAQKRLIDLGLYTGKADGRYGAGTKAAFEQEAKQKTDSEASAIATAAKEREDKLRADELALKRFEAEQAGKKVDSAVASDTAKLKRKEEYDAQAGSIPGVATQIAANTAAPLAGYAGGRLIGTGLNAYADRSQTSKNNVLQGAAEDRVAGLTTRDGARAGTMRSGAMPSNNALLRVGGRMLPHMITGAGMIGKGGAILSQSGEDDPFYPSQANRAVGLGMLGAGVGVLEQGANYAINPGVSPDARAIAIMESNQLRRNNTADPAAPAAPRQHLPGSRGDMMAQAKRYNIPGRSTMNAEALRTAVGEAVANTPAPRGGAASKMLKGMAGPVGAAALAYSMTPDRAQAADGTEPGGNQAEALTNAGIGGGLAYGANKLLGALPEVAKVAGRVSGPLMLNDMATQASRSIYGSGPRWLDVPERNPLREQGPQQGVAPAPAPEDYQGALYPEAVPPQAAAPEQAPAQDFDAQLAELQQLMASIGSQQEQAPQPMQQAQQSAQVAQMPDPWAQQAMPTNRLLAGR